MSFIDFFVSILRESRVWYIVGVIALCVILYVGVRQFFRLLSSAGKSRIEYQEILRKRRERCAKEINKCGERLAKCRIEQEGVLGLIDSHQLRIGRTKGEARRFLRGELQRFQHRLSELREAEARLTTERERLEAKLSEIDTEADAWMQYEEYFGASQEQAFGLTPIERQ